MPMLESITKRNIRYFDSYLFIGNNAMLYLASRFISYKASGYLKKIYSPFISSLPSTKLHDISKID